MLSVAIYISAFLLTQSDLDESVKSQKINLVSFRPGSRSGMTAKPESSHFNSFWTSAFAGVTGLGLKTGGLGPPAFSLSQNPSSPVSDNIH